MMKNRLGTAFLCLATAFAIAACGSESSSDDSAPGGSGAQGDAPAGPVTIKVSVAGGENPVFAPYLVAVGNGYFEDEGIEIEQHIYDSGTLAFSAFAGGEEEFCICGATQLLTANEQGRSFVGVFNQYIGGAVVFIGHKDYETERGTDLAGYDGDKWGYTAEGSVSQVFMDRAAQAAGLEWDEQGHVALGSVTAYIPALQQKQADIITMDVTSAATAIDLGIGYPVFNTNDPATVEDIWGQQLGLPLVTTAEFIEENPDVTQRFVSALVKALADVKANADDPAAILEMMPKSFQDANGELFSEIWPLVKDAFESVDGTFTDQQIQDTMDLGLSTGVIKNDEVPEGTFDNSFVEAAS